MENSKSEIRNPKSEIAEGASGIPNS